MDEFAALREYLGADVGANAVKDPSYWPTTAGITNSAKMNVVVSGFYWHEGLTFLTDPTFTARFWTSTPRLQGMQFAYGVQRLGRRPHEGRSALDLRRRIDTEHAVVQRRTVGRKPHVPRPLRDGPDVNPNCEKP